MDLTPVQVLMDWVIAHYLQEVAHPVGPTSVNKPSTMLYKLSSLARWGRTSERIIMIYGWEKVLYPAQL